MPRLRVVVFVALLVGAALVAGRVASASSAKRFTIFAVPTTVQLMNHEDDRRRGMTNNPFEINRSKDLVVVVVKGTEKKNGPFPGDDVLYSFELYSNAALKQRAGSAVFTCYYDVAKHARRMTRSPWKLVAAS